MKQENELTIMIKSNNAANVNNNGYVNRNGNNVNNNNGAVVPDLSKHSNP